MQVVNDVLQLIGLQQSPWEDKTSGGFFELAATKGDEDEMQDRSLLFHGYEGLMEPTVYGIFDGHGGSSASIYCVENIGQKILDHRDIIKDPKKAIKEVFITLDDEYCQLEDKTDGTTATVLYLVPDYNHSAKRDQRMRYVIASVGDSKAILIRKLIDPESGKRLRAFEKLSFEHRLTRPDEKARIVEEGGIPKYKDDSFVVARIPEDEEGAAEEVGVPVTRSIGDALYRPFVTPVPEANDGYFDLSCEYVVIASGSVWDQLSEEEVMKTIVTKKGDLDHRVQRLLRKAREEQHRSGAGKGENMTVIAIKLEPLIRKLARASRNNEKKRKIQRRRRKKLKDQELLKKNAKQQTVHIPGLDPDGYLLELLLWKSPARTGLWFLSGLSFFFVHEIAGYNMVSIFTFLFLYRLVLSTAVVKIGNLLKRIGVWKDFNDYLFLDEGAFFTPELTVRAEALTYKTVSYFVDKWEYIVFEGDRWETLEMLQRLLVCFSPVPFRTIMFIGFISMFSLLVTYERNKVRIDKVQMYLASVWRKFLRLFGMGAIQ